MFISWNSDRVEAASRQSMRLCPTTEKALHRADLRDVLILAAHPDDCVIMAGEYAIEAIRANWSVQVVYLTCGDADPQTTYAQTRRQEAIDVWHGLGIPRRNLHFMDYPESLSLDGPIRLTKKQLVRARESIATLIAQLPHNAVVFVPARGEAHVDHRILRSIGIEAHEAACRRDVFLMEAPGYNRYYSLVYSRAKALRYLLGVIPIFGQWLCRLVKYPAPEFPYRGSSLALPRDHRRLQQKRSMLRQFGSQDTNRLVRCFGHADRFRIVASPARTACDRVRGYVELGSKSLGPGMLTLLLLLWGSMLVLTFAAATEAASWVDTTGGLAVGALLLIAATIGLAVLPNRPFELRVSWLLFGAGIATATLTSLVRAYVS